MRGKPYEIQDAEYELFETSIELHKKIIRDIQERLKRIKKSTQGSGIDEKPLTLGLV